MENLQDELMDDLAVPEIHEVYFQFNDDEPIKFAYVTKSENEDAKFSLTLQAGLGSDDPGITFSDGKGREFKMFMKKSEDGI